MMLQPFRILIDGTHRAVRRMLDGRACWAYLLTEEEQLSICAYHQQGQRLEIPTVLGSGVTNQDARIHAVSCGTREAI